MGAGALNLPFFLHILHPTRLSRVASHMTFPLKKADQGPGLGRNTQNGGVLPGKPTHTRQCQDQHNGLACTYSELDIRYKRSGDSDTYEQKLPYFEVTV